ncbi:MAG: AraC family transcriptional regulator [Clostridiales bacterium]|nr:AraC family transcriptional regulator [Clostridiales bacterium]
MANVDYKRLFGPSYDFSPRLVNLWDICVPSGESYRLDKNQMDQKPYPWFLYTMVRVISGQVTVEKGSEQFLLGQGALFLSRRRSIDSIRCAGAALFTIYQFTSDGTPPFFHTDRSYTVPFNQEEEACSNLLFTSDRRQSQAGNTTRNAHFILLYTGWIDQYECRKPTDSPYGEEIRRAVEYMEQHLDEKLSLAQLSVQFNLSERAFRKAFKETVGTSPKAFHQQLRLKHAAALLEQSGAAMQEIADRLGYNTQFHFSREFKKHFGVTPSAYRANCRGNSQQENAQKRG